MNKIFLIACFCFLFAGCATTQTATVKNGAVDTALVKTEAVHAPNVAQPARVAKAEIPDVSHPKELSVVTLDWEGYVLIYFWAEWCPPCQQMKPIVEKIAEEDLGYKILWLKADAEAKVAEYYGISSFPTIIIFFRKETEQPKLKKVGSIKGFLGKEDLKQEILKLLRP